MIYLASEDLIRIATRAIGNTPEVRDLGLLPSAAARPAASAFGTDAYPTLHEKAAALMHSLARNHAPVDGNKRLALAATLVLLRINGARLPRTEDEAYDLTVAVASGHVQEISEIAQRLAA